MIVGLDITAPSQDERVKESGPLDALVRVTLVNSRGEIVIEQAGHLRQWSWSHGTYVIEKEHAAFVYRVGEVRQVPIGEGVYGGQWLGVRADGGWGTWFTSRSFEGYRLTLEVLEPAANGRRYQVRLLVVGGGK